MTATRDTAADTRMMGVVHDAIRRDLHRLQSALAPPADLPQDRRRALAGHARSLVRLLHRHHRAEDAGLWPLVCRIDPTAGALLEQMQTDHGAISTAADEVDATAQLCAAQPDSRSAAALGEAITRLSDITLPHLARGEQEMMPIVAATITDQEWRRWDVEYNIKTRSLGELGFMAHWLMDGLDPDRYELLTSLVPAPARLVLIHGYRRRYRRACGVRWGPEVAIGPVVVDRRNRA